MDCWPVLLTLPPQVLLQLLQATWAWHSPRLPAAALASRGQFWSGPPSRFGRLPSQIKAYPGDVQHPWTTYSTGTDREIQSVKWLRTESCGSKSCFASSSVSRSRWVQPWHLHVWEKHRRQRLVWRGLWKAAQKWEAEWWAAGCSAPGGRGACSDFHFFTTSSPHKFREVKMRTRTSGDMGALQHVNTVVLILWNMCATAACYMCLLLCWVCFSLLFLDALLLATASLAFKLSVL